MRTLTIRILTEDAAMQDIQQKFTNTWKNDEYIGEYLTFESPNALFKAITPKCWELIDKLQNLGTVSMRELARQLGRDIHRIHDDIKKLKELGIVEQNNKGVHVPFQKIHTDFTLKAKAA